MANPQAIRKMAIAAAASLLAACAGKVAPISSQPGSSQEAPTPLYVEIQRLEDRMSDAFNRHDLDALMALFTSDLEFYHDTGGLQSFAAVRAGFQGLFAQDNGIRRNLIPETLRVFPVKDYGAVELGEHQFCHEENGRTDCGTFEFIQVWRKEGAEWKIARVISIGH